MTAAYDIRVAMLANGYTPLPCSCETKRPVLPGWPDAIVTAESINGWDIQFPKAQNHGLRLEALDLDISDQDVCEDLESIIRDWFDGRGEILTRFGSPPRRLIPIRVTGDLTKTSRLFRDPSGKQQGLELLGTRSQFLAYGMHPKGYVGWFFMTSGNEVPLRVAEGYNKLDIDKQLINRISTQIEENEIDVVTLDPLITLHGVPESDNTKMDSVIRIFAAIADAHDCAIEISHHMRKPAAGINGDYGAADIRGASAIHDAVRSARSLNRMPEREASDLTLQEHERAKYFRVDKAKGNYSPAIKAVWRQFVNVVLPNGDDVVVVTPWHYPGQGEATPERQEQERTADFVFLQLVDRFSLEGRIASDRSGKNYAPGIFAEEAEARMAKLNKVTLRAAMLRLFKAGKIKAIDEGSGGKTVHKIVRP